MKHHSIFKVKSTTLFIRTKPILGDFYNVLNTKNLKNCNSTK